LTAVKSHSKAQFKLGNCYYKGEGVRQDYKEVIRWCKIAASQGFAEAQI
jgi:TPR repeat protein